LRLLDLNHALTVYLSVWHSHYTRDRFTILVLCHDKACSSLTSALFSAEAGCETGKRIDLSLVFTV